MIVQREIGSTFGLYAKRRSEDRTRDVLPAVHVCIRKYTFPRGLMNLRCCILSCSPLHLECFVPAAIPHWTLSVATVNGKNCLSLGAHSWIKGGETMGRAFITWNAHRNCVMRYILTWKPKNFHRIILECNYSIPFQILFPWLPGTLSPTRMDLFPQLQVWIMNMIGVILPHPKYAGWNYSCLDHWSRLQALPCRESISCLLRLPAKLLPSIAWLPLPLFTVHSCPMLLRLSCLGAVQRCLSDKILQDPALRPGLTSSPRTRLHLFCSSCSTCHIVV